MKELLFAEGFVPILENGEKQITIRNGTRNYNPGQMVIGKCAEGDRFLLEIIDCEPMPLISVPMADLQADGFDSAGNALEILHQWYPDLTIGSYVSVIHFRVRGRE